MPTGETQLPPTTSMVQEDGRGDREVLEDFVLKNRELIELEELLDQFNVFEAMRAERTEARHSDFVAFLLDPTRPHGLGDIVLKSILQAVLKAKGDYPRGITPHRPRLVGHDNGGGYPGRVEH
jgi:hypothetical protein